MRKPSPHRDTTVKRCCEPTRAGTSWVRCQLSNEAATITPTMISGSGTRLARRAAVSAAAAPAFKANRIRGIDDGLATDDVAMGEVEGALCMAVTSI